MNYNKLSIAVTVFGVLGLVVLGISSLAGIAGILGSFIGTSAISTAQLVFGTAIVLGVVLFAADYLAHGVMGWW